MFSLFLLLKPLAPDDSTLGAIPYWICLSGLGVGLVFITLGVLNMLVVRQQITQLAEDGSKKT